MVNWDERIGAYVSTALKIVVALCVSALVIPPVAAAVAVGTLLKVPLPVSELPEEATLVVAEPSTVLDAAGNKIGFLRGFDQSVKIEQEDVPQGVKDAFVAIEDRRFWEHSGVDLEGIGRAMRENIEAGGVAQGGSTITQQYVKNVYLNGEKTIERKVEEALLALEVEKQKSKEEILFGYLTASYFGSGAYGIGAGAEIYFGKSVQELDISEAAMLAGIVKAPSYYDPTKNLEATEERRRLVLKAMYEQEYISTEEYEKHAARTLWYMANGAPSNEQVTKVLVREKKGALAAPFLVDWVESELLEEFGPDMVYRGNLTIETTVDPVLQAEAEAAVSKRLENTEYPVEMSLVSIDHTTGHVKAMVGGRDYDHSQLNLALGGSTGFQPGSSFKPIVMAAAFNMGLSPETTYDAPARWALPGCGGENCYVSNYSHSGYGNMSLRSAMHASVNTVFAQLITDVSIQDTITLSRELGLERVDPDGQYGVSLSLGAAESSPLEMASAYGTFANSGVRLEPTAILRVLDTDGNVLIDNRTRVGEEVLTEVVADNVTDVLVGVVDGGTGQAANIGRPAAGKTGTAQAYRAAWFVGYTPQLSTAVWMGHADTPKTLENVNGVGRVTGGSHPARAWAEFMKAAHKDVEVTAFPEPVEIVALDKKADEIIRSTKKREFTVVGVKQSPEVLSADCGGVACQKKSVAKPVVPKPQTPTTQPPPTTRAVPKTSTTNSTTDTTASMSTTRPATTNPVSSTVPKTTQGSSP